MSVCPSCQAVNPDIYQFCQFCGAKIPIVSINTLENSLEKNEVKAIHLGSDDTQPLNLENMMEEIESGVEEFIGEQKSRGIAEGLENLPDGLSYNQFMLKNNIETAVEIAANDDIKPADLDTNVLSLGALTSNMLLDLACAGKTDVGKQRDRNEDDFAVIFQTRSIHGKSQISDRSYRGLFILCDGMGGHAGGAEASAIAVNAITDQFRPFWIDTLPGEKKLREIVCNANQAIFARNEGEKRQDLGRMGTTLVMLAMHDLKVAIAHVGDSRIYKLSHTGKATGKVADEANGQDGNHSAKLEQITRDHEVCNQLIDLGLDPESAFARPDAHQLTQALGPHSSERLDPAIRFFSLTEPTLFLLCSDGLCDNEAIEQNWQTHLLPILNQEVPLDTGLERLINLGNTINGHDNLTAVLVLCNVG